MCLFLTPKNPIIHKPEDNVFGKKLPLVPDQTVYVSNFNRRSNKICAAVERRAHHWDDDLVSN